MTPETFIAIRKRARLSQSGLADILRLTLRAVQSYEYRERAIPDPVAYLMELLDEKRIP